MKRLFILFATVLLLVVLSACKDDTLTVVVVSTPPPISLNRGSAINESLFPIEVTVLLEDETFAQLEIDWNQDMFPYDLHDDSVSFEGTLVETEMIVNPFDFIVTQTFVFEPIDVIDTIALFSEYSVFYDALLESEVLATLDPDIEYTFLIPSNTAFSAFFTEQNISYDDFLASNLLDEIVRTHIVVGNVTESVLRASSPITLDILDDSTIEVELGVNELRLDEDTKIIGEFYASNGNVLEIDSVFLPSLNITDDINQGVMLILMANLTSIIQDLNILDEIISGDGITIFMPSEDSLITLLLQYDLTIEDIASSAGLLEILTYHIFPNYYIAEDLYTGAPTTIENASGSSFDITVVDGELLIDGFRVVSSTVDDQFGVIHEIDGVLLTEDMITFLEEYEPSN